MKHPGGTQRKEQSLFVETLLAHPPEWGVVIEDEDASPESADDKVVLPSLNLEITNRDDRNATFEPQPGAATGDRSEDSELGADEEQVLIYMVLGATSGPGPYSSRRTA
jgi:hypothetical protein